jgi:beta-lactamase class A
MYQKRRKTPAGCCFLQFLVVVILSLILGYFLVQYWGDKNTEVVSPLSDDKAQEISILEFVTHTKDSDQLRDKIKEQIGNSWKNYSVSVVDYNSKFVMNINESVIFTAASVNKIPILAALYSEVQKGNIDLDRVITLQRADIQDYGTGSIRYDPPGSTYSVKTLARLMMQQSDNTAAFLLANYVVGMDVVQKYVNGWGMTQTDIVDNKTSNGDMALLMKKIMDKKIVGPALSDEMLGFMKDSDFEDRIPGELPKDAVIYHKIGTGVGGVHDIGVVVYGKVKYYIGVFTSDVTDEEQAAKLLAEVSKTIFDYMK